MGNFPNYSTFENSAVLYFPNANFWQLCLLEVAYIPIPVLLICFIKYVSQEKNFNSRERGWHPESSVWLGLGNKSTLVEIRKKCGFGLM